MASSRSVLDNHTPTTSRTQWNNKERMIAKPAPKGTIQREVRLANACRSASEMAYGRSAFLRLETPSPPLRLKQRLRGLLLNKNPKGLDVRRVAEVFNSTFTEGERLEYRKYGYGSMLEMLRSQSFQGYVKVKKRPNLDEYIVKGVILNDKGRHTVVAPKPLQNLRRRYEIEAKVKESELKEAKPKSNNERESKEMPILDAEKGKEFPGSVIYDYQHVSSTVAQPLMIQAATENPADPQPKPTPAAPPPPVQKSTDHDQSLVPISSACTDNPASVVVPRVIDQPSSTPGIIGQCASPISVSKTLNGLPTGTVPAIPITISANSMPMAMSSQVTNHPMNFVRSQGPPLDDSNSSLPVVRDEQGLISSGNPIISPGTTLCSAILNHSGPRFGLNFAVQQLQEHGLFNGNRMMPQAVPSCNYNQAVNFIPTDYPPPRPVVCDQHQQVFSSAPIIIYHKYFVSNSNPNSNQLQIKDGHVRLVHEPARNYVSPRPANRNSPEHYRREREERHSSERRETRRKLPYRISSSVFKRETRGENFVHLRRRLDTQKQKALELHYGREVLRAMADKKYSDEMSSVNPYVVHINGLPHDIPWERLQRLFKEAKNGVLEPVKIQTSSFFGAQYCNFQFLSASEALEAYKDAKHFVENTSYISRRQGVYISFGSFFKFNSRWS